MLRIRELALRQYKSIEHCHINFGPLTLFVGRNGAGKSNIIDSLQFVSDSLSSTLEYAIRERGGIDQVRRKSLGGRPTNPGVALKLDLSDSHSAEYSFKIAAVTNRGFRVDREKCTVRDQSGSEIAGYSIRGGIIEYWSFVEKAPAVSIDRLFLVSVSGFPEFREVYDILTRMTFHNLNPDVMKYPQRPEPGDRLASDGHNLASVIKRLHLTNPKALERVTEYLQAIGIPLSKVSHKQAGALETIEVSQVIEISQGTRNSHFDAVALSDGTIRALGILVSLVSGHGDPKGPSLIGIEEPETALHPAAVGALVDALLEGSEDTQTVLTCHSPDMLDHPMIEPDMIRVVLLENGRTVVGPLSKNKSELMRDHLVTAGELLRLDQLTPDPDELQKQSEAKGTLFESIA